jgi:aspartate racemase
MHIGLIGGIGPAATDFYYRRLISTFASKQVALELTIVHADTPTLLRNLEMNDADAQVAISPSALSRRVPNASLLHRLPDIFASTPSGRYPNYP